MAKKEVTKKDEVGEVKAKNLIIAPRVTEKASMQSTANAYTFVVADNATKLTLSKEIEKTYKVKPQAINISKLPGKVKFIRGKVGHTAPMKKAVVFLKKGDSISFA